MILLIVKLLHSLIEAGDYWFATYLDYHIKKLRIQMLFYDIYLLIIKDSG